MRIVHTLLLAPIGAIGVTLVVLALCGWPLPLLFVGYGAATAALGLTLLKMLIHSRPQEREEGNEDE